MRKYKHFGITLSNLAGPSIRRVKSKKGIRRKPRSASKKEMSALKTQLLNQNIGRKSKEIIIMPLNVLGNIK
jgi:hypothetical protein